MSKGEEKSLVPELRFPEFRDKGEWEEEKLGTVLTLEYGGSLPESRRNQGHVPVVGSNGIVGYHDEYLITGPAIVIGRKGSVGHVNWIDKDCFPIDTTYYVNNKNPKRYLLPFLNLLLERSNLETLKDPSAVPGLNRDNVHSIISLFPNPEEQQKIADCLSSIDSLITAHTQKLDALKAHKKGLMQQLFPAEGETVPKLRFPEFKGDWQRQFVGSKVDLLSGYPFKSSEMSEDAAGIPLMRGINITEGHIRHSRDMDRFYLGDRETVEKYSVKVDDLVIGMDGSKVGKNSALITNKDRGALLVQRVARLRADCKATISFIFQHIHSSIFHSYVDRINTSGGIPHISAKQINEFEICFPPP